MGEVPRQRCFTVWDSGRNVQCESILTTEKKTVKFTNVSYVEGLGPGTCRPNFVTWLLAQLIRLINKINSALSK